MVKQTSLRLIPSSFCFSKASLPLNGVDDLSLHVNASKLSKGVSSQRKSACQWRYPMDKETS